MESIQRRLLRKPEVVSHDKYWGGGGRVLGIFKWKRRKFRDLNLSGVAVKKGSKMVCRVTWERIRTSEWKVLEGQT